MPYNPPGMNPVSENVAQNLAEELKENLVDIRGVDFAYGEQLVLKHINLPIQRGSTLGVIGPNGGGKTTLLRLLLARHTPTRGSITIDGISPREAVARGDVIGYLPQNYAAPSNFPLSVAQVVQTGFAGKAGLFKPATRDDREFSRWLLERVGLTELCDRPISSISGGQRQRAMIARALAARPRLLLLDEPTTGIDASGQKRFVEFLADLRRELNLTLVLVSHDLRAVSAIADRVACLNTTLHYHDAPGQMPAELVRELFPDFTETKSRG